MKKPTGSKKTLERLLELKGNIKLRAFSEKCGIGQSTMHNYLKGRDIKGTTVAKIAIACNCTTDWLLGVNDMSQRRKKG